MRQERLRPLYFKLFYLNCSIKWLFFLKASSRENDKFEQRNLEKIKKNVDIMVCFLTWIINSNKALFDLCFNLQLHDNFKHFKQKLQAKCKTNIKKIVGWTHSYSSFIFFQLSMDLLRNYPAGYNVLPTDDPHETVNVSLQLALYHIVDMVSSAQTKTSD